ncbi:MAG: AgmX/PglI C-terminal domain-containing protein [Polyangiaceae bacterium]
MPSTKRPDSAGVAIVSLRWNGAPLAAKAARSGEDVVVGDAPGSLAPLPSRALGGAALTVADTRGGAHACIPEGKVANVARSGERGELVAGPARIPLRKGDEVSVLLDDFEIVVSGHDDEPTPRRRKLAAGAWVHTAVVAAVHAGLLFAGSRAALASSIETDDAPQMEALRAYLATAEDRSATPDEVVSGVGMKSDSLESNGRSGNGKAGGGERHAGAEGKAGDSTSRAKNRHWGVDGKPVKGDALDARDALEMARDFGIVGVLRAIQEDGVRAVEGANPWSSGDAFNATGGMLGRVLGESEGAGGLALSGVGEGGGGKGDGIGLGGIGTIGHTDGLEGFGTGGAGTRQSGFGIGWSGSWGHVGRMRGHRLRHPRWGDGWDISLSGRLPPEAIQRIIRQNFGRFRTCYQDGLKRNPSLEGRVTVRFVIGRDGSVASTSASGSTLPDAGVVSCVARAFYGISFPQPEGGIVSVVYPIVFSSGE